MIAYKNPKHIVEKRTLNKVITVPHMTEPLGKQIRNVMKNPVDQMLELYSSSNPELLNPIDLKMMSRLDRLRKHNELRDLTKRQKGDLDRGLEKLEKQKAQRIEEAKKKADEEKAKNSQIKNSSENAK